MLAALKRAQSALIIPGAGGESGVSLYQITVYVLASSLRVHCLRGKVGRRGREKRGKEKAKKK
jgi:hypothetical protein